MLKKRTSAFQDPQRVQEQGIYPYFRTISSEQNTLVKIDNKDVLMFGSNNYLGLTHHPALIEAANKATEQYGTSCTGSRFLNGTLDLHIELEKKIAAYVGKEEALVFSTGFQTNLGVVSTIIGRNDLIVLDESAHASIIDGTRLSFGKKIKYRHNDLGSLEKILQSLPDDQLKLIITEGIFSMEGDQAKLSEISILAKEYKASLMVDEAHSLGVLGPKGEGACMHYRITDSTEIIMGTFSKSMASVGGFIAADKDLINYLKHKARSLMFSASLSPANTATVIAALEVIEKEPWRIENLWKNTHYAKTRFQEAGFEIGTIESPIIPIYIRDNIKTYTVTSRLLDQGVFVNPVVAPAVQSSDSLIRFTLMATHTFGQIDEAIEKMTKVFKIISKYSPEKMVY